MKNEFAKHETDKIREFENEGYTASYKCEDGKLINLSNKQSYRPEDIYIREEVRYEGMSNPSDMSILYAIEAKDGTKGTTLVGYGPSADSSMAFFFQAVPKENCAKFDNN